MHQCVMRSHADIVTAAGPEAIAAKRDVSVHTARSWSQRNRIPADHWQGFVREGWATLEELAAYAAANPRKIADTRSQEAA